MAWSYGWAAVDNWKNQEGEGGNNENDDDCLDDEAADADSDAHDGNVADDGDDCVNGDHGDGDDDGDDDGDGDGDDGILCSDEYSGNVTFCSEEMDILIANLYNISLVYINYDEDDTDTIIHVRRWLGTLNLENVKHLRKS